MTTTRECNRCKERKNQNGWGVLYFCNDCKPHVGIGKYKVETKREVNFHEFCKECQEYHDAVIHTAVPSCNGENCQYKKELEEYKEARRYKFKVPPSWYEDDEDDEN